MTAVTSTVLGLLLPLAISVLVCCSIRATATLTATADAWHLREQRKILASKETKPNAAYVFFSIFG